MRLLCDSSFTVPQYLLWNKTLIHEFFLHQLISDFRNSHNDNSLPSLDPPEGLPIKTMKEFEEFEKDVAKQKLFVSKHSLTFVKHDPQNK